MLLYSVYEKQLLAFFNRTVLMLTLGSNIFSPYVYILPRIYGEMNTHIFWLLIFFFSIIFGSLILILLLSYARDLCVCTDASVIVKNYYNFATHFFIVYIYSPCTCIAPSSHWEKFCYYCCCWIFFVYVCHAIEKLCLIII